jgi:hypothetical protein
MIVTSDGYRQEHTLTDQELLDTYGRQFGIELARLPRIS